jgi:hypothetical protein
MAKFAPDATLEGLLAQVALADEMYVCSAQPANYADIANSDLVGPITLTPGNGNGDYCADMETECLSRTRGWIKGDELEVGEDILTLNHDTELSEWQPVSLVYVGESRVRRMVEMRTNTHSSVTTLDHRWPVERRVQHSRAEPRTQVREWATSATLNCETRITCAAPTQNVPDVPKWTDGVVELVAWYFTEGWYEGPAEKPWRIRIGQSSKVNPALCARIRSALRSTFGEPGRGTPGSGNSGGTWYEGSVPSAPHMVRFNLNKAAANVVGHLAPDKVPSPEFISSLTRSQLLLFLDTALDADGHRRVDGHTGFAQTDERRVRAVEMAAALLGIATSTARLNGVNTGWHTTLRTRTTVNPHNTASGKGSARAYVREIEVDGQVWCPRTPNKTWLARRDGTVYYTGNTYADGDISGRKVTVAAQNGASVIASGTATHVVLATGGATDLIRYITTCTSQALTSGNTANVGAWDVEVADPT